MVRRRRTRCVAGGISASAAPSGFGVAKPRRCSPTAGPIRIKRWPRRAIAQAWPICWPPAATHIAKRSAPTTICSSACNSRTPADSLARTISTSNRALPIIIRCWTQKFGIDPHDQSVVWTDDDLERLIDAYVAAAGLRAKSAFNSSISKPATAICCTSFSVPAVAPAVSAAIWTAARGCCFRSSSACAIGIPICMVVVRLSVFDTLPYKTSREIGEPLDYQHLLPYEFGFGVDREQSAGNSI